MQKQEPKFPETGGQDCEFVLIYATEERSINKIHDRIPTLRRIAVQLQQEIESMALGLNSKGSSFTEKVSAFERSLICAALSKTAGNQARAAKVLGIKVTTLNAKIKRYQIVPAIYGLHLRRRGAGKYSIT
jgi:DNA-binding NtrC family response regulator